MEKQIKKEAQKMISSTTYHQEESGGDSSINITTKKRKFEGSSETQTTSSEVRTINLKAGQDVVDAIYQLSEAYDHRRSLSIISATGFISDILFRDQYGSYKCMKVSYMTSLYVSRLVDENGCHCREKATCSISFCNQYGITFDSIDMGRLIAAGPIEIIVDTSKELQKEKKLAGKSSYVVAARNRGGHGSVPNDQIEKVVDEFIKTSRFSPTTPPTGRWKHYSHKQLVLQMTS